MTRARPDWDKCVQTAQDVLDKYDIEEPFVDIFLIAEREGFSIMSFKPNSEKLHDVAGLSKDKVIYVNKDDPPQRQAFTVAHELGHYFLDHSADEFGVHYRNSFYDKDKPVAEKEADRFAAELLMPRSFIEETRRRYVLDYERDISILAKLFAVSKSAMRFRLINLGFLNEREQG